MIQRPRLPLVRPSGSEAVDKFQRDVVRYLRELTEATLKEFDETTSGFVPAPGDESSDFYTLRADKTWAPASGATLADGDYGDVTVSGGGTVINLDPLTVGTGELQDGAVTAPKLMSVSEGSFLGRISGGAGEVENPKFGVTLDFSSGDLERAALTGDVTAAAGSNATTIANDAVTNGQLANMAESTVKGRASGGGAGDPQDLTGAQVKTILGLADMVKGKYAPGSVTLADGEYGYVAKQLRLVSTDRLTLEGDARLVLEN